MNNRTVMPAILFLLCIPVPSQGKPTVKILETLSERRIGQFEKLEINFLIEDSTASNPQWPYDPNPPKGIPPASGISVDGIFTDPGGEQHRQPGFL